MAKPTKSIKNTIKWEIYGIILICVGVLGILSIYTNKVGVIGIFLNINLKGFSGVTAVILPIFIIIYGIYVIYHKKNFEFTPSILGILIVFVVIVLFVHTSLHIKLNDEVFLDRLKQSAKYGVAGLGGGILGETGLTLLFGVFGVVGSYILMCFLLVIGIILSTGFSITEFANKLKKNKHQQQKDINIVYSNIPQYQEKEQKIKVTNTSKADGNVGEMSKVYIQRETEKQNDSPDVDSGIMINSCNKVDVDYKLPNISLLKKNSSNKDLFSDKELLNNAKILENTLESFDVEAKVVQVSCGPTITRFEIQPAPGVKVSKIVNLADDIALSLAARDIRIEAPIPGKAAIGIEVPNKQKQKVLLRDVIETQEFKTSNSKLTIALGKDVSGGTIVADLAEMPHLLIAGATGSGKSVCINTIISSILYKAYPNEVKMMLIDPKVVELTVYDGIPHLLTPVVTDAKKAPSALNWMVTEMERRYHLFAKEGVRDITRYNEIQTDSHLPKIIVIIDELADLMMVSPRDVEDAICRLAQMARAAGIHLIVATQRPSVDIITGLIKANIPSRISFAVSSHVDSRTILDMSGAEKLLGKGDMLYFPVGASKPKRIQGAFISETEVENLTDYVKKQQKPSYEKSLTEIKKVDLSESKQETTDELFNEAVALVVENGQASISLLQRRLHIGYTRAARLIDQMEDRGYVGGYEGTKPREILITREQFQELFED